MRVAPLPRRRSRRTGGALAGAKPVVRYADGPAASTPAVTRYELGDGQAWYASARTCAAAHGRDFRLGLRGGGSDRAGGAAADGGGWPRDLEVVRWVAGERRFITLINHGQTHADVTFEGHPVAVPAA